MTIIIPKNYSTPYGIMDTERAIKLIKDSFEQALARALNLTRISAPLFVKRSTGLNDNLNGIERPVSFEMKDYEGEVIEIIHSLAKWKRLALKRYGITAGEGIYTDMNAIRRDEELDNTHSIYVDQWDWEMVITPEQRTLSFLKQTVCRIYAAILRTEYLTCETYPAMQPFLPPEIHFVHSEELLQMYPHLTPKEREDAICEKYGAVFIIGIGGKLSDGKRHDGRAPDYDDWSTLAEDGHVGLNGDILIWYPVLERSVELSSMGIRVNADALLRQLEMMGQQTRAELYFHRQLLSGKLPLCIGGGIGQSRLCMVLLQKAHVGEIQASIWSDEMRAECQAAGMPLI